MGLPPISSSAVVTVVSCHITLKTLTDQVNGGTVTTEQNQVMCGQLVAHDTLTPVPDALLGNLSGAETSVGHLTIPRV